MMMEAMIRGGLGPFERMGEAVTGRLGLGELVAKPTIVDDGRCFFAHNARGLHSRVRRLSGVSL